MIVKTRHSARGFRYALNLLRADNEHPRIRAMALRSAFIWSEQAPGEAFWHREWVALMNRRSLSLDARTMLDAITREQVRTIYKVESRDHDRELGVQTQALRLKLMTEVAA